MKQVTIFTALLGILTIFLILYLGLYPKKLIINTPEEFHLSQKGDLLQVDEVSKDTIDLVFYTKDTLSTDEELILDLLKKYPYLSYEQAEDILFSPMQER